MTRITMPCTRTGIPLRSIPAGHGNVSLQHKQALSAYGIEVWLDCSGREWIDNTWI